MTPKPIVPEGRTMTDQELNAWCAINAMGWKPFKPSHEWSCPCYEKNDGGGMQGSLVYRFEPTTDPAAAFELLEKCAEKTSTILIQHLSKEHELIRQNACKEWCVNSVGTTAEAPTLERAIAEFSYKIWGGK